MKKIKRRRKFSKKQTAIIFLLFFTIILLIFVFREKINIKRFINKKNLSSEEIVSDLEKKVLPQEGAILKVKWKDFGKRMVDVGVIDKEKFEEIYKNNGGLSNQEQQLVYGENNGNLVINKENAHVLLNLLWAFGLSNRNPVLGSGPIQNPKYGGANKFASTGGWTISKESSMNYFNKFRWITLTDEQQELVEKVSKGIYRPCCDNSTYFPDCNHGMAMLGFLELGVYNGMNEEELYKQALILNSYWFPTTYLTIAKFFYDQNISWDKIQPKQVLGFNFSSSSGFGKVDEKVDLPIKDQGGSCRA